MLRRHFLTLVAATGLIISMPALALTEGTDYVKLATPVANADNTVIKVFSYDCPFCYKYSKSVDRLVMSKLPDMAFVPFHLKTKGKYGLDGSKLMAVALVKDEALGLKPLDEKSNFHKVEMGLYTAYHVNKERWNAGADDFIKAGLEAMGMSRADYDKAVQDPKVTALVDRWEVSYPIAKIQGVPAYVVNGKYLLMTKSLRSIDGFVNAIKTLSAQ